MNKYEGLFELIRKEEVVLFVGAGFSIKAGYPSGNELSQLIYNQLTESEKTNISQNLSLIDLTEEFVQLRGYSRNPLISILKLIYGKSPVDLSDHEKIKSIPHFKNIITTNYDTAFENIYSENHNLIFKDSDCAYIDKLRTNLFKIHGDLSLPDSIVITRSDYRHTYDRGNNTILWTKIKDLLASNSVLFIGYSLEDDNILSIIESITDALGNNRKEMFLIAPSWKDYKKERLNTFGLKYFDDTADNFLNQLNDNIKSHIKDDFDNKRITSETFTQFCENNNFTPIVSLSKVKNEVVGVKSTNNHPIESKLTFSVTEDIAQKINNRKFEDNSLQIKIRGNDISAYPTLNIPVKDLEYSINGITFSNKENIESLHIVKFPNKSGEMAVRSFQDDLYTGIKYEFFMNNHNTGGKVIAKTLLYKLTVDFQFNEASSYTHVTWQTEFDNTFRNPITALHWTKLLKRFYDGGNFSFYLDSYEFNYDIPEIENKKQVLADLERHIEYYQNIIEIEKLKKTKFAIYNKFTEENYEFSKIVLCYLKKESVLIPAKNFVSNFEFLGDDSFTKMVESNPDGRYVFLQTHVLAEPITLNGLKFNVQFKNIIYTECKILNVLIKEDGSYFVEFENLSDNIQVSYSDKGIRQEGLEIKFFD